MKQNNPIQSLSLSLSLSGKLLVVTTSYGFYTLLVKSFYRRLYSVVLLYWSSKLVAANILFIENLSATEILASELPLEIFRTKTDGSRIKG